MENSVRESLAELDGTVEEHFEVCVVPTGVCVATMERPPLRSFFDRLGMFTLRDRAPRINSYMSWMCAVFVIFLVVVLIQFMFVHFLLAQLFQGRDGGVAVADEDAEGNSFAEIVVPTSYDVIMQVVVSLGRMALAASTLIVVCCCFIFKREVNRWDGRIMSGYPLLIMFLHMLVVMGSTFKVLLYNSMLRDKLHIVFKDHGNIRMNIFSALWITVLASTAVFLYIGVRTLILDAKTGSCIAETATDSDGCSTLQIGLYVGVGVWGLLFPVAYCIWLIYADFSFQNTFMPLYKVFSLDEEQEEHGKAAPFLGDLTSVTYHDFNSAAHKLFLEAGVHGVTAKGVIAQLKKMTDKDERPSGSWADMGDGTPRWVAESASLWSWRLRMRHSKNKALELRLLLLVVTAAFAWTVLAAFGASVYRQLCIPSLEELTPSIGQLSPEFDPYIFNYNIFVDTHIKSAGLEVIAEKKFTATTAFHITSLSKEPQTEPWIKKSRNVHVPFLVRNALLDRNASQAEELRASRRAPVPIELRVRGAGTTLVYRITVVKLETRVASLSYSYNTSSSVDEVFVKKKVDWEQIVPAEEVAAENSAFADAETEGAAVYVPEDTQSVLIDMQRELAIFGPTGGMVVSGFELAQFEAARKLNLCPPSGASQMCQKDSLGGSASRVSLDNSVTALPVELEPDGTDPLRFFVSIIRISNRLINLELEGAMGARASSGGEWATMPFLPAFRPLVDRYETFFEVPEARQRTFLEGAAGNEKEEWHTLFLRVKPQGNARSTWLEAELRANRAGDEDLELFCRPAGDDDEPLDPTVEAQTKDLSCGATENEADNAEDGKPTKDLVIRAGEQSFRDHFYVRYKYRLSAPKPFTLILKVMFHDQAKIEGVENATNTVIGHRTYEVKFLPQAPMRLDFFAPLPQIGASEPAEDPVVNGLLQTTHSKRSLHGRKEVKKNFGLPIFLSPPFRSDILVYDAMVPETMLASDAGRILIRMMGSHSLWVGSGDQPLEGMGRGSALRQEISVRHGPNCGDDFDDLAATFAGAPAPAAAAPTSDSLCPVSLRIFERRDGFPRSYGVRLRKAPANTILLVGILSHNQEGRFAAEALPGFRPEQVMINSTFQELEYHWQQTAAAAPAAAQPAAPASASTEPLAAKDAKPKDAKPKKSKALRGDKASKEADASPKDEADDQDNKLVPDTKPEAALGPKASQQAADKQAKKDMSSVFQPAPVPKAIPRKETRPTPAPRKMDTEALLPFLFAQTASESGAERFPDILNAKSGEGEDDDSPLFKFGAVAMAEAPLFANFFAGGAAPASAAAAAKVVVPKAPAAAAPTAKPASRPDPTAWGTGEPVPTSSLAVLAGSPRVEVSVRWNGLELPSAERDGSWWKVQMSGKMLIETCWCDRKQLGNNCKEKLFKRAPRAVKQYYRPNQCVLLIVGGGKPLHEIKVGLAGASSPAFQERALEEAADAAEAADAPGPRQMTARGPAAASLPTLAPVSPAAPVSSSSSSSELLVQA